MARIYFSKTVRYKGETYAPNTPFEVDQADIGELQGAGGWLVEEVEQEQGEQEPENFDEKDTAFEQLKTQAEQLGIEVKGNWGIKKLSEVIEETLSEQDTE